MVSIAFASFAFLGFVVYKKEGLKRVCQNRNLTDLTDLTDLTFVFSGDGTCLKRALGKRD